MTPVIRILTTNTRDFNFQSAPGNNENTPSGTVHTVRNGGIFIGDFRSKTTVSVCRCHRLPGDGRRVENAAAFSTRLTYRHHLPPEDLTLMMRKK